MTNTNIVTAAGLYHCALSTLGTWEMSRWLYYVLGTCVQYIQYICKYYVYMKIICSSGGTSIKIHTSMVTDFEEKYFRYVVIYSCDCLCCHALNGCHGRHSFMVVMVVIVLMFSWISLLLFVMVVMTIMDVMISIIVTVILVVMAVMVFMIVMAVMVVIVVHDRIVLLPSCCNTEWTDRDILSH
jgi:hypothetical protein